MDLESIFIHELADGTEEFGPLPFETKEQGRKRRIKRVLDKQVERKRIMPRKSEPLPSPPERKET